MPNKLGLSFAKFTRSYEFLQQINMMNLPSYQLKPQVLSQVHKIQSRDLVSVVEGSA